jgi:hypothetical protein
MTNEKKTEEVVDEKMGISVPGVGGSFALKGLKPRGIERVAAGHTPKVNKPQKIEKEPAR